MGVRRATSYVPKWKSVEHASLIWVRSRCQIPRTEHKTIVVLVRRDDEVVEVQHFTPIDGKSC